MIEAESTVTTYVRTLLVNTAIFYFYELIKSSIYPLSSIQVANIFVQINDNLKLLRWDESSQQLKTGGLHMDRPESIFKVERTYKKETSISSLKIYLEIEPEKNLGVDTKTKKIIATSTVSRTVSRAQSICGNAM